MALGLLLLSLLVGGFTGSPSPSAASQAPDGRSAAPSSDSSSAAPSATDAPGGPAGSAPAPAPTPDRAEAPAPAPAPGDPGEAAPSSPAGEAPAADGTALAALQSLPVKGRAPKTGYSREQFGPAWADVDRNGCDTRNDVLRRDLADVVLKAGTDGCVVLSGTLHGPYTGDVIAFQRGPGTSTAVQIDHVVSLSDAWQKGAQGLSADRRAAFGNDPLNLLAVQGSVNQSKSDGDAATWLPPLRSARCPMVARQIAVKARYGLWVTPAERDAMARVLRECPGQGLAAEGGPVDPSPETAVDPAPQAPAPAVPAPTAPAPPAQAPAPAPAAPAGGADPSFSSCRKAKAAGYGPYVQGVDAEYAWYRDGDGDGVNCE
ncbi:GmrSD restriction endonuclease domain-containing protein [Micrococcus porci]|uniref:GmrSD restriction endonuclease domain-containing protein n=1 Tax=Micrococcus porci TaxID=2856555 RepID=UPI003CFA8225